MTQKEIERRYEAFKAELDAVLARHQVTLNAVSGGPLEIWLVPDGRESYLGFGVVGESRFDEAPEYLLKPQLTGEPADQNGAYYGRKR